MMLFRSCYRLLSGRYFTICATGIQFLVRTYQIQVLNPPLCKLAAWNFSGYLQRYILRKVKKFQCSSCYSFWNIRERNLRGGWNPPLLLIGLSSFSYFFRFLRPLWTNTSKCMHDMNQTEAEYSRHGKRSQRASLSQIGPDPSSIGGITGYLLRMRTIGHVT